MPRMSGDNESIVDRITENLFAALPIFRKRLLHIDVIQREYNIPLSHVQVLALLQDHGSLTVSEISRRLGIAKPNITPLVDRLIETGMVERRRNETDHRRVNITIRPLGAEKLAQIRAKMLELVGDWARRLSAADLTTLNESLANVTRILGAAQTDW